MVVVVGQDVLDLLGALQGFVQLFFLEAHLLVFKRALLLELFLELGELLLDDFVEGQVVALEDVEEERQQFLHEGAFLTALQSQLVFEVG